MDKTAKKIASRTLEETLQSKNVSTGTTYPVILFRSKTSGQVLYLEAGKDFVDTLLSFLLLPVGTIIHLLSTGIQVTPALGGISSIFESVQNFSASGLRLAKENLVQPRPAAVGCACKSCDLPMLTALETASILRSPRYRPPCLPGEYFQCATCKYLAPSTLKGSVCKPCESSGYTWAVYSQGPYSVFPTESIYYPAGFVKVNTTFIIRQPGDHASDDDPKCECA